MPQQRFNALRQAVTDALGPPPGRNRTTPAFVQKELEDRSEEPRHDDVLEALDAFGGVMLQDVATTTTVIESKANSVLGWTSAILALFVLQPRDAISNAEPYVLALTTIGALAALAGLVYSALTLRVKSWKTPSQHDWFCQSALSDPTTLRRVHLLAMLEMHDAHAEINRDLARLLKRSQGCLVVAGGSLGLQLVAALAVELWSAIF